MPLNKDSLTFEFLRPIFMLLLVIWAFQVVNFVLGYDLNQWFGLEPRDFGGLVGIPASPFLHANFSHIIANTIPLVMLGGMAAMASPKRFMDATVIIVLLGGILVWLFARGGNRVHVGASGLVFGYLGYVIALGIFERSLRAIVMGVAAGLLYGGLVWGVLPTNKGVSWESHLFGAMAGAAAAWLLTRDKGPTPHVR
jgi:membrane associated rhomboid family serine protease